MDQCRIWCVGSASSFQGLVSISSTLVGLAHHTVIIRNTMLVAEDVWETLSLSGLRDGIFGLNTGSGTKS